VNQCIVETGCYQERIKPMDFERGLKMRDIARRLQFLWRWCGGKNERRGQDVEQEES